MQGRGHLFEPQRILGLIDQPMKESLQDAEVRLSLVSLGATVWIDRGSDQPDGSLL